MEEDREEIMKLLDECLMTSNANFRTQLLTALMLEESLEAMLKMCRFLLNHREAENEEILDMAYDLVDLYKLDGRE